MHKERQGNSARQDRYRNQPRPGVAPKDLHVCDTPEEIHVRFMVRSAPEPRSVRTLQRRMFVGDAKKAAHRDVFHPLELYLGWNSLADKSNRFKNALLAGMDAR